MTPGPDGSSEPLDQAQELYYDAMTVGASKGASFLSEVVSLDGRLYRLEVAADGTDAAVTPWEGESGKLDRFPPTLAFAT